MIFAATVAHAKDVFNLLPDSKALISADTPAAQRDAIIDAFKAQQIRYMVNVAVLTTGFDAPHVDLIAILRPTESVSLYQQIIGRGLRLCEGKIMREILVISTHRKWEPQKAIIIITPYRCSSLPVALQIFFGEKPAMTALLLNTLVDAATVC